MKLINIIENRKSAAESNRDLNRELASNQKVKELAIAYTKLGEFAKLPPSPEFKHFLNNKRAAYRDHTTNTTTRGHVWYPSDIIVARENGLPDNWMEFIDLKKEKESNQKVKALAIEYERVGKNFSRLPLKFRTYLKQKKAAYRDYTLGTNTVNSIWYPSDIIVARKNGLPDNWMEFIDLEKESNQKVKELAIAYTKLGEFAKLPPSPEFRQFLNCKRRAYRDHTTKTQTTSHVWYPSDIIVARENGLPDNWMVMTRSQGASI